MTLRAKRLTKYPSDDLRREQLFELLDANVNPDNETSLVTGEQARHLDHNEMGIYMLNEDDQMIAGLYGTGDYNGAADAAAEVGPDSPVPAALIGNVMVIERIAVLKDHRNQGIGSRLLRRAYGLAVMTPAIGVQTLTFDNTIPGLYDFYVKNGFQVINGKDLIFQFAHLATGFISPQLNPNYRWAFREINPGLVRIVNPIH